MPVAGGALTLKTSVPVASRLRLSEHLQANAFFVKITFIGSNTFQTASKACTFVK
jgi:hypothetical protein